MGAPKTQHCLGEHCQPDAMDLCVCLCEKCDVAYFRRNLVEALKRPGISIASGAKGPFDKEEDFFLELPDEPPTTKDSFGSILPPTPKEIYMGDFRFEVNAVGGHGCQRDVKDGGEVYGCGSMNCPDCLCAKFIQDMKRAGASVKSASLTHWPGQPCEVLDTFDVEASPVILKAKRTRKGSF